MNVGEARSPPRRVYPGLRQNDGWRTCQDAVQTIDYRLTGISEPRGCRCRGDQSGSCARSREHRAMRLRASSGLTQPAWKPIPCSAIRCTMAKKYSCALRESPDSRLRPSHVCTSSAETKGRSALDPRRSFGLDGLNFGAEMLVVLTNLHWQT